MGRLIVSLMFAVALLSGCETLKPVSADEMERIDGRASTGTLMYGTTCRYDNGRIVVMDSSSCP